MKRIISDLNRDFITPFFKTVDIGKNLAARLHNIYLMVMAAGIVINVGGGLAIAFISN
jgi:hypothetical protein